MVLDQGKTSIHYILENVDSGPDQDFDGNVDSEMLVIRFLKKMNRATSEEQDKNMQHVKKFEKIILSK
jgi:hypothetical protein